jgi:hypothetical protein
VTESYVLALINLFYYEGQNFYSDREYIVYPRYTVTANVGLSGFQMIQYEYAWYDPDSGKYTDKQIINGAGFNQFNAPGGYPETPEYHDWVLYIRSGR